MTDDSNDEIRKAVQELVDKEQAAGYAPPDRDAPVDIKFIQGWIAANELGRRRPVCAALCAIGSFSARNSEEWYKGNGVPWEHDVLDRALWAVEAVVDQYLLEQGRVIEKLKAAGTFKTRERRLVREAARKVF